MVQVYMGSIYTLTSLIGRRFHFEFDFCTATSEEKWKKIAPSAFLSFGEKSNQVAVPLSGRPARDGNNELAYYLASARSKEEVIDDEHMEVVARVRQLVMKYPGRESFISTLALTLHIAIHDLLTVGLFDLHNM